MQYFDNLHMQSVLNNFMNVKSKQRSRRQRRKGGEEESYLGAVNNFMGSIKKIILRL